MGDGGGEEGQPRAPSVAGRNVLLLVLAVVAGCVDAVSYLAGAIAGGAADSWWVPGAFLLPRVFVAAVVATRYRSR